MDKKIISQKNLTRIIVVLLLVLAIAMGFYKTKTEYLQKQLDQIKLKQQNIQKTKL